MFYLPYIAQTNCLVNPPQLDLTRIRDIATPEGSPSDNVFLASLTWLYRTKTFVSIVLINAFVYLSLPRWKIIHTQSPVAALAHLARSQNFFGLLSKSSESSIVWSGSIRINLQAEPNNWGWVITLSRAGEICGKKHFSGYIG